MSASAPRRKTKEPSVADLLEHRLLVALKLHQATQKGGNTAAIAAELEVVDTQIAIARLREGR